MRGVLLFTIICLGLSACGGKSGGRDLFAPSKSDRTSPEDRNKGGSKGLVQAPQENGKWLEWTPKNVEITCAQGQTCPYQVGLLIFVGPGVDGKHPIFRCTGFIVGPSQVMANGHCDHLQDHTAYFVTANSVPGGRQMRKVIGLHAKAFTLSDKGPKKDSGRADAAIFNLESPIGIPGLQLATRSDVLYNQLIGFVLNETGPEKFVIDRIDCLVRRNEALFPFSIQENPEVLVLFNCYARGGNSGGPLFAPGSWKVQAIVQGGASPEDMVKSLKRPLKNYENHWIATATNARCLDMVPGACVVSDYKARAERFMSYQQQAWQRQPTTPLQFNEWAEVVSSR